MSAERTKANAGSIGTRSFSPISDCPLCGWPVLDAERLAKILATLAVRPIGKKISLSGAVEIMGHGYKAFSRDLHTLIHGLRLPVKRSKRCAWLAAPVQLCQHHSEVGEQFCQTEHFKTTFAAEEIKAKAAFEARKQFFRTPEGKAEYQAVGWAMVPGSPPS
jgi:hypothetical protein